MWKRTVILLLVIAVLRISSVPASAAGAGLITADAALTKTH
jgi:hypothetical protein